MSCSYMVKDVVNSKKPQKGVLESFHLGHERGRDREYCHKDNCCSFQKQL